jgi:predicted dehydrogenase
MVRMARDMVAGGEIGEIRSIAVEYVSQYQSEPSDPTNWQSDPERNGPLGVVAGTGTHAHHLAEFVTGLRLVELSADLASLVPGHRLDDHATMHLRFDNGARGYLWNTTIAPGNENGLGLRIYRSKGGLNGRRSIRTSYFIHRSTGKRWFFREAALTLARRLGPGRACHQAIPRAIWRLSPTSTHRLQTPFWIARRAHLLQQGDICFQRSKTGREVCASC